MANKLHSREVFEAVVNNQEYIFTCYSQSTSYGFRHIATTGYNNTTTCKYIKNDIIAKSCYYNRTWERFKYETVLRKAINNLEVTEDIKQKLKAILIDKTESETRAEAENFMEDFKNTFENLSEKNKQHVRNGLGDNLITTEEQAKNVLGVMKMMSAFEALGL